MPTECWLRDYPRGVGADPVGDVVVGAAAAGTAVDGAVVDGAVVVGAVVDGAVVVGAVVDDAVPAGAVPDGIGAPADAAFARQNRAVYCHDSRWPGMGA